MTLTMAANEARNHPATRYALASSLGDDFRVDNLYVGDFAALDTPLSLGIEYKSMANLCSSLASGELDEQLAKMVDHYDITVLLAIVIPPPDARGKVAVWGSKRSFSYNWLIGSIAGWAGRGVVPMFISDESCVPAVVSTWYGVAKKEEHRNAYMPKQVLPSLRRLSVREQVMGAFPGVGERRLAKASFAPLRTLANLSLEEWRAALGKVLGKAVYDKWGE